VSGERLIRPAPGDVLVYHGFTADVICLYLFRRPKGAHVVMDLETGDLVDVGRFGEGSTVSKFERWE
jgi:hypothetical protein